MAMTFAWSVVDTETNHCLSVRRALSPLRPSPLMYNSHPDGFVFPAVTVLAEDLTEALHKAIAAERSAFALKRAADPMGRGRTDSVGD